VAVIDKFARRGSASARRGRCRPRRPLDLLAQPYAPAGSLTLTASVQVRCTLSMLVQFIVPPLPVIPL
jgi:hypothetical protein